MNLLASIYGRAYMGTLDERNSREICTRYFFIVYVIQVNNVLWFDNAEVKVWLGLGTETLD